jgi:hypothetical protein
MDVKTALRDPIWQSVAAVIGLAALVAAVIPLVKSDADPPELNIVHAYTAVTTGFSDMLGLRVDLRIDGVDRTKSELVYQQFFVINSGTKSILSTDFLVPLTVVPQDTEEILGIETKFDAQDIQKDVAWTRQSDNSQIFIPRILAPGESMSVVALIDRTRLQKNERKQVLKIGAKLSQGKVRVFEKYSDYLLSGQKFNATGFEIQYNGTQLIFLLGLLVVTIYLPLSIASEFDLGDELPAPAFVFAIICALAVLASEAICSRWFASTNRPTYYNVAVLVAYIVIIFWLVDKARRAR